MANIVLFYFILLTIQKSVCAKYSDYYAQPLGIYSDDDDEELLDSYFYLQQTSRHSVDIAANLQVKRPIYNLTAELKIYAWTGYSYRSTSGAGDGRLLLGNACNSKVFGNILKAFKPQELLDTSSCSFQPGNLTSQFNMNEIMHRSFNIYNLGRLYFAVNFSSNAVTQFGFKMELQTFDLKLYEYTLDY